MALINVVLQIPRGAVEVIDGKLGRIASALETLVQLVRDTSEVPTELHVAIGETAHVAADVQAKLDTAS